MMLTENVTKGLKRRVPRFARSYEAAQQFVRLAPTAERKTASF